MRPTILPHHTGLTLPLTTQDPFTPLTTQGPFTPLTTQGPSTPAGGTYPIRPNATSAIPPRPYLGCTVDLGPGLQKLQHRSQVPIFGGILERILRGGRPYGVQ